MKYTKEQLFEMIQAIVATVAEKDVADDGVITATAAIVELVEQNKEADDGTRR